jgi:flagellar M-ring protein FliF
VDGIINLINNMKARLGELSFNQKVLLGAVATASVISISVFSLWLQHEENAVLFANMSPEDASVALEELAKQDVKAELTNGGSTIMVPENMVHRLRVDLAAKGVPSTGVVGFEIFDGKQYGLTEFLQNVNFKRALEGELTKSIESLQGIQSARVHLVLPKPSIFNKLSTNATASVVLRMGRGAKLGESQINGIQSLVAGSVENLGSEGVTVIDQHGTVLSNQTGDEAAGRGQTQLALRREVEAHLSSKAASMLDEVLGAGRSIVRVDATLNFEKIDTQREVYDPQTVVRSEERTEANDPSTGGTDENSITNYEINRTVEHVISDVGGVKSLTVAVFVDGHYEPAAEGEDPVYRPLSDEEIGQLRRIVQTAVGLSTVRGDQIEVVNMQFRQQGLELGGGAAPDWIGIATQYGGRVILLIMLAVLAFSLKSKLGTMLTEAFQPAGTAAVSGGKKSAGGMQGVEEDDEHFEGIPEMNDQVITEIQDYASENPERVAEVILSWVHGIELGDRKMKAEG